MEAVSSLISSPPQFFSRAHLRNCSSSSSSVLLLYDQVPPALTPQLTTLARHSPSSVLIQDQRDESRTLLSLKEENTIKAMLDRRLAVVTPASSSYEENNDLDTDRSVTDFQLPLQNWLELSHLWLSLQRNDQSAPIKTESISSHRENFPEVEADHVIALAREALSACKEAASIAIHNNQFETDMEDNSSSLSGSANVPLQTKRTVRSTRLPKSRTKKRKLPKLNIEYHEIKKIESPQRNAGLDQNDPLRMFLWGPETRQLLTGKEESELIMKIQELMRLQEVRNRLETDFSREPTLAEWAAAVGISCQALQSQVHCGNISREKLIYANFRLVVHIAKQYQGRGLNFQDLLQEGSMGLMRSVEKFKPQAGCRFATYAYWWIRQSIRKSIFQHSRTIRLPENVYALLSKVYEARKSCFRKGNHHPLKEEIAASAGMSVEKLESLLSTTRMPLSIQKSIWMDQDTTFQEVTADNAIESPDMSVSKQLMRQHVRNLLGVLNPRERKIIRMRFGIEDGNQMSLSEIGAGFGLSKERVRQLESRALYKLKQCMGSQGLAAYSNMLV